MKKIAVAFFVALGVLFAAVTLLKRSSSGGPGDEAVEGPSAAERSRTLQFWEIYRVATEHRIAGRVRQAADGYARALELNDRHEDALYYLGSMQLELGEFAEAEGAWRRLLAVNPYSGRAHSRLGVLYSCLEPTGLFDLVKAEAEFEGALRINKEQIGPLLGLAEVALIRGDPAAASSYLERVLVTNSTSVAAHLLEGYIAWSEGDRDAAATAFAAAVEHARPSEAVGGVAGEGDTEAGAGPMLAEATRCQGVQPYLDDLSEMSESDLPEQFDSYYGRLANALSLSPQR